MNCAICGRSSERPVCRECTLKIMDEHPFLLRKSQLCSVYENALESEVESGLLTDPGVERLNFLAREALKGEDVDYGLLVRAALLFHRKYSFYLENFEIEQDYYLSLAEKFVSRVGGEEGEYLKYLIEIERGNLKGALKIAESLLKYGSKYKLLKARLLMEMGDREAAFLIYEELLKEDPGVWRQLGDALFSTSQWEDALKIYGKVLELEPENWEVHYLAAVCLFRLGRYEESEKFLKNALRINKYHLESYHLLLKIYRELGMDDERKTLITKIKRLGFPGEVIG